MNIEAALAWFARKIIAKHKPFIIGVTGSVGKTSTRHAIAAALSSKYFNQVREPQKNYNNTFGIPITIIGTAGIEEGNHFVNWTRIFLKALSVWLLESNYPKYLILEYGIDHRGDMDDLVKIAKPNLAVLTNIGIAHLEHFGTREATAQEKIKLAKALRSDEVFVYNADDERIVSQLSVVAATKKIGYSMANVSVAETLGVQAKTTIGVTISGVQYQFTVPVIGHSHVLALVASIHVAIELGLHVEDIERGLLNYRALPGRLSVLAGIKRTILLDDSYNASPDSVIDGLQALSKFNSSDFSQRIAVLGDMLELGDDSENEHRKIGGMLRDLGVTKLVTCGTLAANIARAAIESGLSTDSVWQFGSSSEAIEQVKALLEPGAVVLIKGSQSIRMEKITKELLLEPTSAHLVLCRQYGKWLSENS